MMKSLISIIFISFFILFFSCAKNEAQERITRSYKGHENDKDAINLVKTYPNIAGTTLDNCQTCHRGGVEDTDTKLIYNSCDYCHLIPFPNKKIKNGIPQNYNQTLNEFGRAYMKAGRSTKALADIAGVDSDNDGFTNDDELKNQRFPGESMSKPNQPLIPYKTVISEEIMKIKKHNQFLLLNHTKHSTDEYISYSGIKLKDFLESAGVDLAGATGITAFAPDGFSMDYTLDEIISPFPEADFFDLRNKFEKENMPVEYSSITPSDLKHKSKIQDSLWIMIALERDGKKISSAYYQEKTGHIKGAGPYRLVVPQTYPGKPDRGIKEKKYNDGWDFDESLDHNAGRCIRGMCVIRVNPLPEGYEEYDWRNGWFLIQDEKIVIYGHGVFGK
ncbi:MAG: hypothetical protein KAR38_08560 [Calditrichia bacterium]|nr:hypothetical protein [Calditrichia bacterium]